MLNKKGMSLAEVIISIALISVVLVFMIKLLIDLNNQQTNNTYAKNNQVNRAEILRFINNDLNSKTLSNINDSSSDDNNLIIELQFLDGTSGVIHATTSEFSYTNSSEETRSWTMNDCQIYVSKADVYFSSDQNIYTMFIDIEIHTVNEQNEYGNNNTLDDIILSYIGDSADFSLDVLECLGNSC